MKKIDGEGLMALFAAFAAAVVIYVPETAFAGYEERLYQVEKTNQQDENVEENEEANPLDFLFGSSMDLDGTRMIVGDVAPLVNAAYIHHRDAEGHWGPPYRLVTPNWVSPDAFGHRVAIAGDWAMVGAPLDNGNTGAVWVFKYNSGTDTWDLHGNKLTASNAGLNDYFGACVTIEGDTAVIGAREEDAASNQNQGAVYVFKLVSNNWTQQQLLRTTVLVSNSMLGWAAKLDGNSFIASAKNEASKIGAAYIFTRPNSTSPFAQVAKLTPSDGAVNDEFGYSVDLKGDRAIVGNGSNPSAVHEQAYVFHRSGTAWTNMTQTHILKPIANQTNSDFGRVAIDGDRAIVGAAEQGAVHYFKYDTTASTWRGTQMVRPTDFTNNKDRFGEVVAFDGTGILVGAPGQDAIYGFDINPVLGDTIATLAADDPTTNAYFGWSVDVNAETAAVGAYGANAVYIFKKRLGGYWEKTQKLVAADGSAVGDQFGNKVSFSPDGKDLIIGSQMDVDVPTVNITGSAYVFSKDASGNFVQQAKLLASDRATNDRFGCEVSIDGNFAIVGAWAEDSASNNNAGAVYVYARTGTTWNAGTKIVPTVRTAGDNFGNDVDISGTTIAVSALGDASGRGAAYVYTYNGTIWTNQVKLVASDGASGDNFGSTLDLDVDTLIVGAPLNDDPGVDAGSAYVFTRTAGVWGTSVKATGFTTAAGDQVGWAVAVEGNVAVAGLHTRDLAYVFEKNGSSWLKTDTIKGGNIGTEFGRGIAIRHGNIIIGSRLADIGGTDAGLASIFGNSGPPTKGLSVWLDAKATGGDMVPKGGVTGTNTLETWLDKSLNANHVSQATATKQPAYTVTTSGHPVITFDGTDDMLSVNRSIVTGGTQRTVLVVAKASAISSTRSILGDGATTGNGNGFTITPEVRADVTGSNALWSSMGTTSYRVLTVVLNGNTTANFGAYLDGTALAAPTLTNGGQVINTLAGSFTVGAKQGDTNRFQGTIAEVLIYNRALGVVEREAAENYLKAKWVSPLWVRKSLHIPDFEASEADVILDKDQLLAQDLNSSPTNTVYTVSQKSANMTLKKNGVVQTIPFTFTQDDVNNLLIKFSHTGAATDSHAWFNFTIQGATPNPTPPANKLVAVRLTVTPDKGLFGHADDFKDGSGAALPNSQLVVAATKYNRLNASMTPAQWTYFQTIPGRIAKMWNYANSQSSNSDSDARSAESLFRKNFGIMMGPAAKLVSAINATTTTLQLTEYPGYPKIPIQQSYNIIDAPSGNTSPDLSNVFPTGDPAQRGQKDHCVFWIRIDNELMKVTAWDPVTKIATVVRGFDYKAHVSGTLGDSFDPNAGSLCTQGAAHSANASVFSPMYFDNQYPIPTGPDGAQYKTKIRYTMDWSTKAGLDYHAWKSKNALIANPNEQQAIWWDVFSTVHGAGVPVGGQIPGVAHIDWCTNPGQITPVTGVAMTFDADMRPHELECQNHKIGYVKNKIFALMAGFVTPQYYPEIMGNNYWGGPQRTFMVSSASNLNKPADGMLQEHFDERKRALMLDAVTATGTGVPAGGLAIYANIKEIGFYENASRYFHDRYCYAFYLMAYNTGSRCMIGTNPIALDDYPLPVRYINPIPQYYYPVGTPLVQNTAAQLAQVVTVNKAEQYPWLFVASNIKVERREYTNAVVLVNMSGFHHVIPLPSYTGPSGTTNQYIDTRTGKIVTSWTTTGTFDSTIMLKLKNN